MAMLHKSAFAMVSIALMTLCPVFAQDADGQGSPPRLCADIDEHISLDAVNSLGGFVAVDGASIAPGDIVKLSKKANSQGSPLVVIGGLMVGADFNKSMLGRTCFIGTNLENADFSLASGDLAFVGTNLAGSDFGSARMPGIIFRNSDLSHMDASAARFSWGMFSGGWFNSAVQGWVLNGADMAEFQFECGIMLDDGCPVYQGGDPIQARGANFYKADLSSFPVFEADVTAATLNQASISPRQLTAFSKASFEGGIGLKAGDQRVALTKDETLALVADAEATAAINEQPNFDCAKAGNSIETLICAEYESELRTLDRRMAAIYAAARAQRLTVRVSQQAWLKQRNACAALDEIERRECVTEAYQDRIGELVGEFGDDDWLAPGESALFVDDVLPLSSDMRASPLFARIAPVLAAASFSEAVVARNPDGGFDIVGQAVGANAHLCSLNAKGARLDPKQGWYIVPHDETASFAKIFRIIGDELQIIGNGKPEREDEMASIDFVSCGMRAYFPDMRRIAVSPDLVDTYRDSLNQSY